MPSLALTCRVNQKNMRSTVDYLPHFAALSKFEPVTSVPPLTRAGESTHLNEILQVPFSCRPRRPSDCNVVPCAQAALESVWPFPKHPLDRLGLPLIQLLAMAVMEMRLRDEEFHAFQSNLLGCQNGFSKPLQSGRDSQRLLVPHKLVVVGLPLLSSR